MRIFVELSDARILTTEAKYKRLFFIRIFVVKIVTSRATTIATHDVYVYRRDTLLFNVKWNDSRRRNLL